jgi:DNA-binding NarL/FixJ family response regulator
MNVPRDATPRTPIRMVLADDHPLVLIGLQLAFKGPDFKVLTTCEDGVQAVEAVRQHKPDVLILDLQMPRLDGFGVLRELRKLRGLTTSIIVLSGSGKAPMTADQLGVHAVMSKSDIAGLVIDCVRTVHQRKEPLPTLAARPRLRDPDLGRRHLSELLTRREIEIARLIAEALPNKLIARKLNITEGTVKVHLHRIYDKLGVRGRMGLLLRLRQELLGDQEPATG